MIIIFNKKFYNISFKVLDQKQDQVFLILLIWGPMKIRKRKRDNKVLESYKRKRTEWDRNKPAESSVLK